jgi:predicted dehydrogenase
MLPDAAEFGIEPTTQWGRFKDAHTGSDHQVSAERGNWRHFYQQLRGSIEHGQPLPVDPHDALTALQIIAVARDSAASLLSRRWFQDK